MSSLRKQTVTGMIWSLLQNVGGGGLSFIVTIVLARILTPEIFGLIGMLTIVIELSSALVIAGFNEALIQKKDTDEKDYSSVFWINLVVSILLYVILFFGAPLIAEFYRQPDLTLLTRVLSLAFVINAFSYVQEARLRKTMNFKTLTIVHLPSIVIAGAVSITFAVLGFGVWSIVAMELTIRLAFAIQIWIYSRWRPAFIFDLKRIKRLFSFGSKLMLAAILSSVFKNLYLVVIGRFFPLSSVGLYQNGYKMIKTPSTIFSASLNSVAFPAFSSIQDDDRRLKEGYKKIIQQVLFWICPIFILSGVMADSLFHFVFGEKWMGAVPFFRILCVVGIFYPLSSYNLSIINVKGRSDLFFRLEIVKRVITAIGVVLAIPYGIWALVGFQAVNSVFAYFLNTYFSGRFIDYPVREQMIDIFPIFMLSTLISFVVYLLLLALSDLPDWGVLFVGFTVGGGLYWMISSWSKFSPYMDFVEILRNRTRNISLKQQV